MNTVSRGIRNAFRNSTRTVAIVAILGLSMGLALSMLIANKAVSNKIQSVKASVGNTITVAPAGFNGGSQVNNSLTTSELSKVSNLDHVSSVNETLTDRLSNSSSTSTTSSFGGPGGSSTSSNAKTSLTSPVTLNTNTKTGGGHFFVSGGGSLPTNFSLPVTIIGTNDPSTVDSAAINLTSGKAISGTTANNEALVSQAMAKKNSLKVGSTFTAYSTTLTVAGIFANSATNSTRTTEDSIIVSLPTEQSISSQTGDITSATITVDSLDNLSSVTAAVKDKLGSSADVTSSIEEADETVAPLNSVKNVSMYSLIGAIIAGAVIILLTMVMIVRERTREIGVFKAIGASNSKVTFQFMSEAVTLTVLGAIIGILLGAIAAQPITNTLVSNSSTSTTSSSQTVGAPGEGTRGGFAGGIGGGGSFNGGAAGGGLTRGNARGAFGGARNDFTNLHAAVGFSIVLYGIGAALIIAIVGSAAVSYFIAKIRPAEVMRTE
jgi:putative ABC transport system permease protein